MKKHLLKTILPALLLVLAVFIIGSGCSNPEHGWTSYYEDVDGDGYGVEPSVRVYGNETPPIGYVGNNTDCDDTNADIYPGAIEVPDNGIDENCNGLFGITFYKDSDNDGFGDPNSGSVYEVSFGDPAPDGMVYNNADCDDTNPMINPLADEIVGNDIDDNCDGDIDIVEYYTDADGDGYGAGFALPPPAVGVNNNLDCDDTNPNVHPYAMEIPGNGIDDNCDGRIDELI
ncbi:putative metal-binding motif-containing protein [Xanthomarina sp.]|uniref:putative metal-binding motif-containing protein n=1 Tax=Xanthomarina sp. TaxID=1931211 RepID=UPI002CF5A579|nr:putative metal-binding motif-containing protein [Xanthomarina sp.]HLV39151.1 putative metal-binding motif-containing protein [Xanthomarina sp.]